MIPTSTTKTNSRRRIRVAIYALGAVAVLESALLVRSEIANAARTKRAAAVVATVNGQPITQSDVADFSSSQPSGQVLGILVDFKLLDQAAAARKITISRAELDRRRHNMIVSEHAKSYADAAKAVRRTAAGLDSQMMHAAILENLATLELPKTPTRMVHARGILIRPGGPHAASAAAALSLAQKLQHEVDAGTALAPLADKYSDDSTSRDRHGDMGIVQDALPGPVSFGTDTPAINALLGATPRGHLDAPVKGDNGYWVLQIVSTASHQGSDGPQYDALLAGWRQYWIQRLEPGVINRLRSKATVEPPLLAASGR